MNYVKLIGALLLALLLTSCSRKKEALQTVDRFMHCAKDSLEKCETLYPGYDSLNVALDYEKYAIDLHPETSGDTVKVKVKLLKYDEFGFKHLTDVLLNVLPSDDKQMKVVSSHGLLEYSKQPMLYTLAQKTGAVVPGETDAQLCAKYPTLKEMSKNILANFEKLVTVKRNPNSFWMWGYNRQNDSKFHLGTEITINNKMGVKLRNVVVHAKTLVYNIPYSNSLTCVGSKEIAELPHGVSTYEIETLSKRVPDDSPRFGEYALKSLSIELPADAQIKYIESYKFKGDEYKKYVANKK